MLLGLVIGVYLAEVVITHLASLDHVRIFATGIFGVAPAVAWPLAPLLHKNALHFVATVFGLMIVGVPLEKHFQRGRFIAFISLGGYIATVAGAVVLLAFTEKQVAVYGTSGIIYAFSGFALTHIFSPNRTLAASDVIAIIFGIAAAIDIVIDPVTGPYFAPGWVNGAHIGGLLVGLVVGWFELERADR